MLRNVVEQASNPVPGRTGQVDLDIIIPVFNEELGIENLFTRRANHLSTDGSRSAPPNTSGFDGGSARSRG